MTDEPTDWSAPSSWLKPASRWRLSDLADEQNPLFSLSADGRLLSFSQRRDGGRGMSIYARRELKKRREARDK